MINIFTLSTRKQRIIKVIKSFYFTYLTWSGDGKYIAYALKSHLHVGFKIYSNFAAPIHGGESEQILENLNGGAPLFEWAHKPLSMDPANLLTTTWAQLKTQDQK